MCNICKTKKKILAIIKKSNIKNAPLIKAVNSLYCQDEYEDENSEYSENEQYENKQSQQNESESEQDTGSEDVSDEDEYEYDLKEI